MTDDRNPMNPNERDPDEDRASEVGSVDPRDVRLSAELDGAAASATPGTALEPASTGDGDDAHIVERRRELAVARDLLAIPPPPLDDITRRRLVRAALAEAPAARRRDRSMLTRAGVAAAVLAVLVAGGVTLKAVTNSGNVFHTASGDKSSKAATASTGPAGSATDFRELSDPLVLRSRVERALRDPPASTTAAAPLTGGENSTQGDTTAALKVPLGNCAATVRVPAGATPTVLGDGTFHGAPAIVLVAHNGGRTLIFVVARADCRLLTSQFFGE